MKKAIIIKNKKASFEFSFVEEFVAGIVLFGSEVKSLKNKEANFTDSYCYIKDNEVFLKSLHISEYKFSKHTQHDPKRDKKLLLTKREIRKLIQKTKEKGLTIVPITIFMNEKGLFKVVIALSKGKKNYDKREVLKEKDEKQRIKNLLVY